MRLGLLHRHGHRLLTGAAVAILVAACGDGGPAPDNGPPVTFVDATSRSPELAVYGGGASWAHTDKYAPGIGLGDLDGDGHLDLVQPRSSSADPELRSLRIYRGLGDGRFEDATDFNWPAESNATAVVLADFDGDDDLDLFVGVDGAASLLLRNDGDFEFTDISVGAGLAQRRDRVYAASAGDVDGDGDLDLYLGIWNADVDVDLPRDERRYGPGTAPNQLLINSGDGSFSDQAGERDAQCQGHSTLGLAMVDVDNDSDLDIYVANDFFPDCLLINDGDGRFRDVAGPAGIANGASHGMGVAIGDLDGNGFMDILVTDDADQDDVLGNALWLNHGDLVFSEGGTERGLEGLAAFGYQANISWGAGLVDFDLDGDTDVHVATHRGREQMVWQQRDGLFETSRTLGSLGDYDTRGSSYGDLNGDGAVDMVIGRRLGHPPQVALNETTAGNSIRVRIHPLSRAPGTRIVARVGGIRQVHLIQAGESFMSSRDNTATIGLGLHQHAERVEIWPAGASEPTIYNDVSSGTLHVD